MHLVLSLNPLDPLNVFLVVQIKNNIDLPARFLLWVFLVLSGFSENLRPFQGDFRCCVSLSGHLAIGAVAPLAGSANIKGPVSTFKVPS